MCLLADQTPTPAPDQKSEEQLFSPCWAITFAKAIAHLTYAAEKDIIAEGVRGVS